MSCSAGALSNCDVPVTVVTLLFIAMDPSSSAELKRDIMVAVDTICQSIKGDSEAASATVSTKVADICRFILTISLCRSWLYARRRLNLLPG